jgi:prepilin-type processing-associated H-X9-DG protein
MRAECPPGRRSLRGRPLAAGRGRAFTVLELLVAGAIVGLLLGLVLPALHMGREAARRSVCRDRLRQLGVALTQRHGSRGCFPAGWKTVRRTPTALGWGSQLLDYLEQGPQQALVDARVSVAAPQHGTARRTAMASFLCPSDRQEARFALFRELGSHDDDDDALSDEALLELPAANYLGVYGQSDPDADLARDGEGPFVKDREISLAAFERGASHVLLVGERTARRLPATWLGIHLDGEDAAGRVTGQALLGPNRSDADECEFDSRHPGGVNFAWGDGRVAWVADDIDSTLYRRLAQLSE